MEAEGFTARPGERVGPYRLLGAVGRGGMGAVYRAEAAESCPVPAGRIVALKLLYRVSAEERRRAQREVAYLQALAHPGIVRVLDFGEHEGRPYIVMPLVEGTRLDRLLTAEGPLPGDRAARIAIGALEGLHVAHLAGILHRDVKPGNLILRPDGQVVVLDFGLASAPARDSRMTRSDAVLGTPAYMSPEQAAGDRAALSPRSDVYALGAVLYEMLSGSPPFAADNAHALLRLVIEAPLVPPSRVRPDLPRDLETVVLRALARDPRDRYVNAEAMAADLRRFLDGRPVLATRPGPLRPLLRLCWRRRRTLAAAGLAAFVLLGLAVLGGRAALLRHRPDPVPGEMTTWATELVQVEPLLPVGSPGGGRMRLIPLPTLGQGMHYATLPAVSGPVRLAATVTPLAEIFRVDLLVGDRDIGQGYTARLSGDALASHLELLRESRVVASKTLPAIEVGRPLRLILERSEDGLEARLNDPRSGVEVISFLDLVPLEGPKAAGCYLAADPTNTRVAELVLDRQRTGTLVSGLAPADILRQDGLYQRALGLYDAFLADHPESPQTRDAELRAGLCLEALGKDHAGLLPLAIERFQRVIQRNRQDRRYVLVATFHTWACQLKLGRLDEAERSFTALRRDYPVEQLLAHVPATAARDLLDDHLERAQGLSASDPSRALDLFLSGANIATYLRLPERAALGWCGAGDILRDLDDSAGAEARYRQICDDPGMPSSWRAKAQLKLAEMLRLEGRADDAVAAYNAVNELAGTGDLGAFADLWLGDLLAELGDEQGSNAAWAMAATDTGLAGRFARALLGRETLDRDAVSDPWYANDVAFIRARLAERAGDWAARTEYLRQAAAGPLPSDWPSPLARKLLAQIENRP